MQSSGKPTIRSFSCFRQFRCKYLLQGVFAPDILRTHLVHKISSHHAPSRLTNLFQNVRRMNHNSRLVTQASNDLTMKLSIQLVAFTLISATSARADNVIRYLFNHGDEQTGLECTASEYEKIAAIFDTINTPLNLRKRSVEIPERELQSKSDSIHQLDFDAADFSADGAGVYHVPNCQDNCVGYDRYHCIASSIEKRGMNKFRDLQTRNGTQYFPPICRNLCRHFPVGRCMADGCHGYRRSLSKEEQGKTIIQETVDRGQGSSGYHRQLPLVAIESGVVTASTNSNATAKTTGTVASYPANCKTKCAGQTDNFCTAVGCKGYRRDLHEPKDRKLPTEYTPQQVNSTTTLSLWNTSKSVVKEGYQEMFPAKCKRLCAGQVSNNCMGVVGCRGYRRALRDPVERELHRVAIEGNSTLAPSFPEEEGGNATIAPSYGRTYPPYCRERCRGFPVGQCREPGCMGYRRRALEEIDNGDDRGLQARNSTFSGFTDATVGTYPSNCRRRCAGQVDSNCMGVPGCQVYRRVLQEEEESVRLLPADWCVKASQSIDEQLNNLLPQLSSKCRALIQAPRRKECYNNEAICAK